MDPNHTCSELCLSNRPTNCANKTSIHLPQREIFVNVQIKTWAEGQATVACNMSLGKNKSNTLNLSYLEGDSIL